MNFGPLYNIQDDHAWQSICEILATEANSLGLEGRTVKEVNFYRYRANPLDPLDNDMLKIGFTIDDHHTTP